MAEVLAATDIVEVIGASLDMKSAGPDRFVALCPFHNEKTPSFSISRGRQIYYCFGCERSGDALSFLCDHDGLTFPEALEKLANRAGVRLPAATEREDQETFQRKQVRELNAFALRQFQQMLNDPMRGGDAREYLRGRGLRTETVEAFALGYAPDGYEHFLTAARRKGYKDGVLEASGLARKGQRGGSYDFFRQRLMFPIRDAAGHVVAFGGRDLSGETEAKYINTPENAVYKKSRVLYGLYEGRTALRQAQTAILVEGYFDLLRCVDAGIPNVVAPCGTALTEEQAQILRRYVPEVTVVFDGDEAGARAALRAIAILVAAGLTVRALSLPGGQDPDDYIKAHGGAAFRELLASAQDFVTFFVGMNHARAETIEGRAAVARELFDILHGLNDALRREQYIQQAAKALGVHPWTLQQEYAKEQRRQGRRQAARETRDGEGGGDSAYKMTEDDRMFIAALLQHAHLREECEAGFERAPLPGGPVGAVLSGLFAHGPDNLSHWLEDPAARQLYGAAAAHDAIGEERAASAVRKRVLRLKKETLKAEAGRIMAAIREAEKEQDTAKVLALMKEKAGIQIEIERAGAV